MPGGAMPGGARPGGAMPGGAGPGAPLWSVAGARVAGIGARAASLRQPASSWLNMPGVLPAPGTATSGTCCCGDWNVCCADDCCTKTGGGGGATQPANTLIARTAAPLMAPVIASLFLMPGLDMGVPGVNRTSTAQLVRLFHRRRPAMQAKVGPIDRLWKLWRVKAMAVAGRR